MFLSQKHRETQVISYMLREFRKKQYENSGNTPEIPYAVFYLKFFEHPSFGQVAHEIYASEWKVHSSEISIIIMYCWYMFLMAVATDLTHVTILI